MQSESHTDHEEGPYPVPKGVSAIDLDDNFRFSKDHFAINPRYKVSEGLLFKVLKEQFY